MRSSERWKPPRNRLAIISGSKPYSIVIANAMRSVAGDFGWDLVFGPEIVQTPTTEWRPVLNRVRAVEPAVIANTHFYAVDLAHFQRQFMEHPINSLIYLQYGAMHQSFVDLAKEAAEGVTVGTVIGLLHDEMGHAYAKRYHARFGENSTPGVGCLPYSSVHHYAIAASLAGGSGAPGDFDQNRRIAQKLKETIYRSVVGTINYHHKWQAAIPYPDATSDPSLGVPHLFFQIQDYRKDQVLIAPEPYNVGEFHLSFLESGQAIAVMPRVAIELPIDLFALQGLMEALQQAQLAGRVVSDADMAEVFADVGAKTLGVKAVAIVGDQEGRFFANVE